MMNLNPSKQNEDSETMLAAKILRPGDALRILAGRRKLTLDEAELDHYRGERARRGNLLPRGFQKVQGIEVIEN